MPRFFGVDEGFQYASEFPNNGGSFEIVIRELRSVNTNKLFFKRSSILKEAKTEEYYPFKDNSVMDLDSKDPFVDFRLSMEEIVETRCLTDWDYLEEFLICYLKINSKSNHGCIVGAFLDLLVH
ncbi:Transcription repressor OFP18 [Abeliophyllum distichum]|uniref:Transcription repressor n=1 Tax=Abeliophyllum distichum TaxID=126358 RepID=A0ABD1NQY0_9LAMI